jgi:hypothetical protein
MCFQNTFITSHFSPDVVSKYGGMNIVLFVALTSSFLQVLGSRALRLAYIVRCVWPISWSDIS